MNNKLIIGLLVACVFVACTAPADAAVARRGVVKLGQKTKTSWGKAGDGAAKYLWKNKEGIAIGSAVTAIAMQPKTAATGTSSVFSSVVGGILFYLLIVGLIIAGGRFVLHSIGLWRIVPLVILALLLSCGVAEAGVFDTFSGPEVQCSFFGRGFWNIVTIIITIATVII